MSLTLYSNRLPLPYPTRPHPGMSSRYVMPSATLRPR
jgi:hypothetical protein